MDWIEPPIGPIQHLDDYFPLRDINFPGAIHNRLLLYEQTSRENHAAGYPGKYPRLEFLNDIDRNTVMAILREGFSKRQVLKFLQVCIKNGLRIKDRELKFFLKHRTFPGNESSTQRKKRRIIEMRDQILRYEVKIMNLEEKIKNERDNSKAR